jgi:hypothetical protein
MKNQFYISIIDFDSSKSGTKHTQRKQTKEKERVNEMKK